MTPPNKTLYLETLGCQMNALDSELVLGSLLDRGYRLSDDLFGADLVVINTCSVRQHAEDKVYSRLGQLKSGKGRRADQIVAVIGCMAERDGDGLLAKMPHVDILCGPSELHRMPGLIDEVSTQREPPAAPLVCRATSLPLASSVRIRPTFASRAAATSIAASASSRSRAVPKCIVHQIRSSKKHAGSRVPA